MALGITKVAVVSAGRHLFQVGAATATEPMEGVTEAVSMLGDFAGVGSSFFGVFDGAGDGICRYLANNIPRQCGRNFASDVPFAKTIEESVLDVHRHVKVTNAGETCQYAIAVVAKDTWPKQGKEWVYIAVGGGCEAHYLPALGEEPPVLGGTGVVGEPDLVVNVQRVPRVDGALILATRGVWAVVSPKEALEAASASITAAGAAAAIRNLAVSKGAKGQASVVFANLTL